MIDSAKLLTSAVEATHAATNYLGTLTSWEGTMWKVQVGKLVVNLGVAEGLARTIDTMTPDKQRGALKLILEIATGARVLLETPPASASSAEATGLSDTRLAVQNLQKAAAEASVEKKSGGSSVLIALGILGAAGITLFLVKRD